MYFVFRVLRAGVMKVSHGAYGPDVMTYPHLDQVAKKTRSSREKDVSESV